MRKTNFLSEKIIAHRGIHYKYIENTIDAFRSAMLRNYPIELDIRLTKDNIVIVFHDSNLKRLTGIDMEISEATYTEIKDIIDAPTLKDVLLFINGRVPIIIETKFSSKDYKLEKLTSELLDNYKGEFAIQSFSPLSLLWFKRHRKNYIRGFLINSIFHKNIFMKCLLNKELLNVILKPTYIGVNIKYITNEKIINLRNKYMIIGYTINNDLEYNKYKKYADNFICNIGKEPYI